MAKFIVLESCVFLQKDFQKQEYSARCFHYVEGVDKIKTIRKENWDKDGTFSLEVKDIYKVEEGQEFIVYRYFNEWYQRITVRGSYKVKFKVENSQANPITIYDIKRVEENTTKYSFTDIVYTQIIIDWEKQYYLYSGNYKDGREFKTELKGNEAIRHILGLNYVKKLSIDVIENTKETIEEEELRNLYY